jgi:hypothetical protein
MLLDILELVDKDVCNALLVVKQRKGGLFYLIGEGLANVSVNPDTPAILNHLAPNARSEG